MQVCMKKNRFILVLSVLLGAVNAVGIAFVSLILQRVVDIAMQGDETGFWRLFGVILLYIGCLGVFGFAEAFCGKVLLRNVTKSLRTRIFEGVMEKKPAEYYNSNSADYLSAIVNDVKMVEENYLMPLLLSSQMIVLFFATLIILFYLSPMVTGILIGFLLLMFLVPAIFGKALQKRQDRYSEMMALFTAKSKDFLSGYEVIRGFFIGRYIQKSFQEENDKAVKAKFSSDRLNAVNESLAGILSTLSSIIVIFVAAYMVLKGNITVGTLLALIQLSSTFSLPVLTIMQNLPKITGMKPVMERLDKLCTYEREPEYCSIASPAQFNNRLEVEEVIFGYEQNQNILNGLSINIEAGKKYAVLGDSGCGKTTLIKLLTGYSKLYEGNIRYDGKEVRDISTAEFSRLVAEIHQNVYLFDTNIYQNICLDEHFSEEEWRNALENSGINRFADKMEAGIYTKVGENGNRLSGGQRQRVAVARALIRKTPILILDEGTSAVDQQTACEIEKDLLEKTGLTLITITHHMIEELREYYHTVVYMEQGKVSRVENLDI